MGRILKELYDRKALNKKSLAVLIDPDSLSRDLLEKKVQLSIDCGVDYFFVGGSLITNDDLDNTLSYIKQHTSIPTILFPGSVYQVNNKADALLFLSLISGRNAELLIGKHVTAAPLIKESKIEVLSTGYMLVDGGEPTTASYVSGSLPIPNNKPSIAAVTAMAGEMLGLRLNFLDAGSGAKTPVTTEMIAATSLQTENPLIVGGGITTPEKAEANWMAGADVVVVGNALETTPSLIKELASAKPL